MNKSLQSIIRAFISGASLPAVFLFYHGFKSLESQYKMKNMKQIPILGKMDPYFVYSFFAPLYFGTMSVCAILLSKYLNINFRYGYFIVSLISPILVSLFIKIYNVYTFDKKRWLQQYFYLLIYHMINYNLIISNVYNLIN